MRYELIDQQRAHFPVSRLCRVLGVSVSGYYGWRKRPLSQREMANQELVRQIEMIYQHSQQTYGSPRVYAELRAQGWRCNHKRVERLMRGHGLQAKQTKRTRPTRPRSGRPASLAPNRLAQDFTASQPNQKWLTDITYIPTAQGWLYLAVVMDLFSRRIIGWAMAGQCTQELVKRALQMAVSQRRPPPGLLHHSDQGAQYTSQAYQALLAQHQLIVSLSHVGRCYDNAPMESFFATLKTERVYHRSYRTRAEAKTDLFAYIEGFYNRQRRHSALGYLSPVEFEQAHLCLN
jgi:transposase InsO family protein